MAISAAIMGALGAATYTAYTGGNLFFNDGSSLSGWTVSGATVDATIGNPAPSLKAYPTKQYAYIAPPGITDLIGKSIKFDCKLGTSTALANLFFGCDASGVGRMLRLDMRGSVDLPGVATTTSWTAWSTPSSTFAAIDSNWHTYQIDIKTGPVVDVWKDGVKVLSNISIVLNGTYIGISGDGGSQGGNFDNISIFNTV